MPYDAPFSSYEPEQLNDGFSFDDNSRTEGAGRSAMGTFFVRRGEIYLFFRDVACPSPHFFSSYRPKTLF